MLQDILTYTSVSAAFAYAAYSFWQVLFNTSAKTGCSSGCSACGDKAFIMKAVEMKKKGLQYKQQ